MLDAHPGESPVYFWMVHCGTRQKVATAYKVDATPRFVTEIERILGKDVVKVG